MQKLHKKSLISFLLFSFLVVFLFVIAPNKEKKTTATVVEINTFHSGKVDEMPTYYNSHTLSSSFGKMRVEIERGHESRFIDVIIPSVYAPHFSGDEGFNIGDDVYFYITSVYEVPFPSTPRDPRTVDIGIYVPKNSLPDSVKVIRTENTK